MQPRSPAARQVLDAACRANPRSYGDWKLEGGSTRPWDFRPHRCRHVPSVGRTANPPMAAAAVDQPHDGALRDAQPADARLAAHHSGFIPDLRRLALGGARRVAGPELMTRLPVDRHLSFSLHLKGLVLVGSSSVSSIHHDRSGKRCPLKVHGINAARINLLNLPELVSSCGWRPGHASIDRCVQASWRD